MPTAGKRDLEDIIFGTTGQHDLSSRVTRGDYVVDLGKVAEAMLARCTLRIPPCSGVLMASQLDHRPRRVTDRRPGAGAGRS